MGPIAECQNCGEFIFSKAKLKTVSELHQFSERQYFMLQQRVVHWKYLWTKEFDNRFNSERHFSNIYCLMIDV